MTPKLTLYQLFSPTTFNPRTLTRKFIPPKVVQVGGGGMEPLPGVLVCCSILKRFYL